MNSLLIATTSGARAQLRRLKPDSAISGRQGRDCPACDPDVRVKYRAVPSFRLTLAVTPRAAPIGEEIAAARSLSHLAHN